eukprot:CAMPEP_0174229250 /NCGR_PEP_ID=MMETSP0417-20130205/277_1 /TAXON_ID=242541 /ORGANISM="Mayorella sp, Strain BSH-02190019" /LENGTH=239 /DNA_ID=CAMNT_0015306779 /DNA_START=24 /DNA_END=743 /DNA_ORIENTATION=+
MIWTLIYGLVMAEGLVCLVLVLPMPRTLRRLLSRAFLAVFSFPVVRIFLYCLASCLAIMFVDCQRTIYHEDHMLHNNDITALQDASRRRLELTRAQRNSYLCGSGLFLLLLLFRLDSLLRAMESQFTNTDALQRQSKNANTTLENFMQQISDLKEENKLLKKAASDADSKSVKAGALATQAENSQKEYLRLLQETEEQKKEMENLSNDLARANANNKELYKELEATKAALVQQGDKKSD